MSTKVTILGGGTKLAVLNGGDTVLPSDRLTLAGGLSASTALDGSMQLDASGVPLAHEQSTGIYRPESYGAAGDGQKVIDAVAVAGDATLTSAAATFTAADVGKLIYIAGAGAGGVRHETTIAAFNSAHSIEMAAVAITSIDPTTAVWGTDDTVAIQTAIDTGRCDLSATNYLTRELTMTRDGRRLVGVSEGGGSLGSIEQRSCLIYLPTTATAACLDIGRAVTTLYPLEGNTVDRVLFTGDGSEADTNALVRTRDVRQFVWTLPRANEFKGIGWHSMGRDSVSLKRPVLEVARPIVIGKNPSGSLFPGGICDVDMFVIDDAYLWSTDGLHGLGTTYPIIQVGNGAMVLDAACVSGDKTVTSATANWTGCEGWDITLPGAGAGGVDLLTHIDSVTGPGSIEVHTAPTTSVNPARAIWSSEDMIVNRLNIGGGQAWMCGRAGLEFIDASSDYVSTGWNIGSLRYEQGGAGLSGWIFHVEKTGRQPLTSPTFHDCGGGSGASTNGWRLRNVWSPILHNCEFEGNGTTTWLDVDGTVTHLQTINCVVPGGGQLVLSGTAQVVEDTSRGKGPGSNAIIDCNDPTINPDQWSKHYGLSRWSWVGWLHHGDSKTIPIGADRETARITAFSGPGDAAGLASITVVEDLTGAYLEVGTLHTAITDANGCLCIIPAGGASNPVVKNNLGTSQKVAIDAYWQSVNEGGNHPNFWRSFDYDMQQAGVAQWTVINAATITKDGTSPHTGTQALRIAYNGTPTAGAWNNGYALTPGATYTLRGWARGDAGAGIPQINDGGTMLWSGTNSVAWQAFDVTFVAGATTHLSMYNLAAGAGWVEFDDLELFAGVGP